MGTAVSKKPRQLVFAWDQHDSNAERNRSTNKGVRSRKRHQATFSRTAAAAHIRRSTPTDSANAFLDAPAPNKNTAAPNNKTAMNFSSDISNSSMPCTHDATGTFPVAVAVVPAVVTRAEKAIAEPASEIIAEPAPRLKKVTHISDLMVAVLARYGIDAHELTALANDPA